ncbi:hepatic and glial cell adhesion molecule-like isoform X2 [Scyliorhinus torazame]|uniref:hepatic and glial cell adhesion molecule-like isoform X2 n=1 Tax=Scyliorhinus torazame TaxID=75743 RepID=UPI003B5CC8FD
MQVFVCGEALNVRTDTINNAIAGEQALFPIQHQGTDQYDVTFRSKSPVAFKIFTWKSNNPEELHIVHPLYKHRVGIDGGFVMLNDVQVDDNGEYEINIDYYGTELKNRDESTFRMQVFEPVSQPETAILGNCKSSSNITLNCFVSNGTNVMMHWEKLSLFGVLNETYDGTLLVIDCVTEEEQYVYRCIAENPVSNATSDPLTVSLYNGANPKGKIHRLMFLVPLVMAVLAVPVPIILYLLWSTFFKGSRTHFYQPANLWNPPGRPLRPNLHDPRWPTCATHHFLLFAADKNGGNGFGSFWPSYTLLQWNLLDEGEAFRCRKVWILHLSKVLHFFPVNFYQIKIK